jgi:hypothetical protein
MHDKNGVRRMNETISSVSYDKALFIFHFLNIKGQQQ